MTSVCSEILDKKYGCEYIRSSINVNMGPLDKNKKLINHRKLKPHQIENSEREILAREKELIKFYDKWKTINCSKDLVLRKRKMINNKNYGITAKIDKRMNVINKGILHNLICVVTLVHKNHLDKYHEFIVINENNIDVDSKIELIETIKLNN